MRKVNKKIIIVILVMLLCLLLFVLYLFNIKDREDVKEVIDNRPIVKLDMDKIKNTYSEYAKIKDGSSIYIKDGDKYVSRATIHGNIEISLDNDYKIVDEYFKLVNSDYYVKYSDIEGIDSLSERKEEYKNYHSYIPYNENVVLGSKAKLYVDNDNYYEVSGGSYPIIIKDTDRYGIEFNKGLVYVNSSDVINIENNTNTESEYATSVGVLNYHYVVSATNEGGELEECKQTICITDTMFDSHVKYLKDSGYYGATMRDLELFIDGKVQLPKKTVVLTFDDGWYVARTIGILNKYNFMGTLFLIGSLASPNDYASPYLEVHSHSWNMHKLGDCPKEVGRGGIMCLSEETILEDLKRSRESLENTPYFCYPFYDYNERSINLLKKAGFRMAFAGGERKVRVGQDKFRVPRYVIVKSTTMDEFISYVS